MSAGISEPVESPFGWNLVQVSEIVPRVEKSLDDVREELRRSLALERARETIFEVLETFEDARAGGATLEAAAAETRLRVQPIGPVARNGGTPSGGRADDLDRQTLATLFATGPGESSRAVERDDGGFFALRVDDIQAPRIPPLSEIRDRVATAWQDEERQMAAERTAAEIAVQARASGSLTAAAAKAGYTTTTTEPFDRNGNGADVPVEAVELVFEAKADDVVTAVTPSGVVLARLVEIVAPPADAPERARLRGALAQSISNDLQAQLANAFREQYGVDVDTAGLRRLFGTQ
jgi:peptidyl-prolyl cis-trans isomerase D